MTWDEIALGYETDKSSRGHGYMGIYEQALAGRDVRSVLEIGVASGGSLALWAALFPDAHVVGVDLAPSCRWQSCDRITVIAADGTDPVKMAAVASLFGPFDLIVDDGSHVPTDVLATHGVLWDALAPGGVYAIEDLYHPTVTRALGLSGARYEVGQRSRDAGSQNAGPCVILLEKP